MVDRRYLLGNRGSPGPAATFINQQVVPMLIEAAAAVEVLIGKMSATTRRSAAGPVAAAFCVGAALGVLTRRRD